MPRAPASLTWTEHRPAHDGTNMKTDCSTPDCAGKLYVCSTGWKKRQGPCDLTCTRRRSGRCEQLPKNRSMSIASPGWARAAL